MHADRYNRSYVTVAPARISLTVQPAREHLPHQQGLATASAVRDPAQQPGNNRPTTAQQPSYDPPSQRTASGQGQGRPTVSQNNTLRPRRTALSRLDFERGLGW